MSGGMFCIAEWCVRKGMKVCSICGNVGSSLLFIIPATVTCLGRSSTPFVVRLLAI